jgi:AraC-like DNA-binding protein
VIPGGYIDIVFNVGDQVCLSDSGGVFFDQAGSSVAGPFDRFWRFHAKGRFDFLGVRFHLGRTPFWHSIPLKEVRNRAVPLAAILEKDDLKAELKALEIGLAQISLMEKRIACMEQFLFKFARFWEEPDAVVTRSLSLIDESKGRISIEALAYALQINARQLERKFTHRVGLSPKTFCRLARFHHAKSMLESIHEPSGADLAYACGYYDQTHLIQEFRLFTGLTPTRYERLQPVGFFLYDALSNR